MLRKLFADKMRCKPSDTSLDIPTLIRTYASQRQRVTYTDVREHIYMNISEQYRSVSVDDYIQSCIDNLCKTDYLKQEANYYILASLCKEG